MLRAQIIDGQVVQFPFTEEQLRRSASPRQLPYIISDAIWEQYNAVPITVDDRPIYDQDTHSVSRSTVPEYIDGEWRLTWTVSALSQDVINARILSRRENMTPLSRRQVFIMLAEEGHLSDADAEAAAAGNLIPAQVADAFQAKVDAGEWDAAQLRAARITFNSFTQAFRTNELISVIVSTADPVPDDDTLDTWWQTYVNV